MRAVAFQVIFFIYIFSASAWVIDVTFFAGTEHQPQNLKGLPLDTQALTLEGSESIRGLADNTLNPERDGSILDRVGEFAQTGYFSIWTILELLSGTYAFNALEILGLPAAFITFLKLIFPMLVAFNVIYFLIGRY